MYTFRCCQTQPNQIDIGYIPPVLRYTKPALGLLLLLLLGSSVSFYFQDHPAQEEFSLVPIGASKNDLIFFVWQKLRRLQFSFAETHTHRSCSVIERETLCVPITTVAARAHCDKILIFVQNSISVGISYKIVFEFSRQKMRLFLNKNSILPQCAFFRQQSFPKKFHSFRRLENGRKIVAGFLEPQFPDSDSAFSFSTASSDFVTIEDYCCVALLSSNSQLSSYTTFSFSLTVF